MKKMLEIRNNIVEEIATRRNQFSHPSANRHLRQLESPLFKAPAPTISSTTRTLRRRPKDGSSQPNVSYNNVPNQELLQPQQAVISSPYSTINSAKERMESATQVETNIAALANMYTSMVNMVSAQGEITARIDDDMEAAYVM